MPQRTAQISMTANDLIIAVPLENIPGMPSDPAGRAQALQHIKNGIQVRKQQQAQQSPVMGALNRG